MKMPKIDKKSIRSVKLDEDAIIQYCEEKNMKAYFAANSLFITTPFGNWYMNPYESQIKIFHGNSKTGGKSIFLEQYHVQGKSYDNCYEALDYIYVHDFNKLKREEALVRKQDPFRLLQNSKKILTQISDNMLTK